MVKQVPDIEALGEWDHGVEPAAESDGKQGAQEVVQSAIRKAPAAHEVPDVEVLGEWDHGIEPAAESDGKATVQDVKSAILKAERAVDSATRNIIRKVGQAVTIDPHTKAEISEHTEEEVAGMKLAVKKTVHQDSFVDPSS